METLYEATVELYESYFKALAALIEQTPNTELDKLNQLNLLAEEAEEALQFDLGIFDKAISMDAESAAGMKDELKIQSIYDNLKK